MLKFSLMDEGCSRSSTSRCWNGYFAEEVARVWELGRVAMAFCPDLPVEEGEEIYALMEQALLTERNAKLDAGDRTSGGKSIDRIVVAVGAAHLPGEGGILRLMEDAGWAIAPAP